MTIVRTGRRNTGPISFYDGPDYTPDTIGSWVAKRDLPWNTVGTALRSANTEGGSEVDDLMTAEQALKLGGLDFDVRKAPVKDAETDIIIPKLFTTYMDDEKEKGGRFYFAGVTDVYEAVRPSRALAGFDEILSQKDGAHYSAVWSMREKAQMGMTIEFPESIIVDPNGAADEIGLFGIGGNSFDGSTGLWYGAWATRWFCMNQYTPNVGKNIPRSFSMKHTKNVTSTERLARAKQAIGLTENWAMKFDKMANELFAKRCSVDQFRTFISKLKPFNIDATTDSDLVQSRKRTRLEEAVAAWEAPHNSNITGTKWGAFNVMTEWADWGRTVNGSPRTGTDSTRQRAIGSMVNATVSGYKKLAWELVTA
jgi:hypothetical protein